MVITMEYKIIRYEVKEFFRQAYTEQYFVNLCDSSEGWTKALFVDDTQPIWLSQYNLWKPLDWLEAHNNKLCLLYKDILDKEMLWRDLGQLEKPSQELVDLYITAINLDDMFIYYGDGIMAQLTRFANVVII